MPVSGYAESKTLISSLAKLSSVFIESPKINDKKYTIRNRASARNTTRLKKSLVVLIIVTFFSQVVYKFNNLAEPFTNDIFQNTVRNLVGVAPHCS